jgi:hypothetical protein
MRYTEFLASVHALLQPERYLEIGVRTGKSLALARCRSVGIDPDFDITAEIDGDVTLIRTTSDEYFARENPLAPMKGQPFDLAFIDGLHLFEFALRDFIYAERHSTSRSVIIFDDMLPRSVDEAARERHTREWTGDVYWVIEVLAAYRPDLSLIPVDTSPTGLLLVVGLDPQSTVLSDSYDEIMARFRTPDPQPVPQTLLDRLTAINPDRVLAADFWNVLRSDADPDRMRAELASSLRGSLGEAFAPTALSAQ